MATITSQILVGHNHDLSGGIIPTHILLLSEGSKPVWILKSLDIMEDHKHNFNTVRWISSTNNILEDALLMISLYILKDQLIIERASRYLTSIEENVVDLSIGVSSDNLDELHKICRKLRYDYKLILSCLKGTSLNYNLSILKLYSMEIEVCKTIYSRCYNPFGDNIVTTGEL